MMLSFRVEKLIEQLTKEDVSSQKMRAELSDLKRRLDDLEDAEDADELEVLPVECIVALTKFATQWQHVCTADFRAAVCRVINYALAAYNLDPLAPGSGDFAKFMVLIQRIISESFSLYLSLRKIRVDPVSNIEQQQQALFEMQSRGGNGSRLAPEGSSVTPQYVESSSTSFRENKMVMGSHFRTYVGDIKEFLSSFANNILETLFRDLAEYIQDLAKRMVEPKFSAFTDSRNLSKLYYAPDDFVTVVRSKPGSKFIIKIRVISMWK